MTPVDGLAPVERVELRPMPHVLHIRHAAEDWSGITDQKQRKKLQNRLNKRLSRQRQRETSSSLVIRTTSSVGASSPQGLVFRPSDYLESRRPSSSRRLQCCNSAACPLKNVHASFSFCNAESITQKRAILYQFAEHALESYAAADPCADHRLRLIQLNLINGLTRNAAALGFTFDWLLCEVVSPFGRDGSVLDPRTAALGSHVPDSLVPTSEQLRTRHHPWVDLFPLPALRDNLLMATQFLSAKDEQELYDDLLESGGGRKEWSGLVVWGEPSDLSNWEASLPFIWKWGWLLRDCPEILQATNLWRRKRGERPVACPPPVEEVEGR